MPAYTTSCVRESKVHSPSAKNYLLIVQALAPGPSRNVHVCRANVFVSGEYGGRVFARPLVAQALGAPERAGKSAWGSWKACATEEAGWPARSGRTVRPH